MTSLLGGLYGFLIRTRNRAYSAGLLSQHRLPGPVISIGNLTLGGSGKTPLAIYIAQTLFELGFHSAILSRGYGRKNSRKSWILSPGETVLNPDSALGDEPALMRRYLPSIWMGISANRFRAGSAIAKAQPATTFILDDGFQHRRLHRNLDIVIIDPWQPLESNRIFPAGTLREPVSELRRCHLVVINGRPDTKATDLVVASLRNLIRETTIFFCTQRIQTLIPFACWQNAEKYCASSEWPHSACLVTAVGNPARFQRDIQQLGIEVRGVHFFRDHYRLEQKNWDACIKEARIKKVEAIITTEKDAVKILQSPEFPLHVAMQTLELSDESNFRQALVEAIKSYSPDS